MSSNDPVPVTPKQEKEAAARRWPHYFVLQMSEHGIGKLRDRLCRIFSKQFGRYGWDPATGKCVDPLVNDAAQQALTRLLEIQSPLKNGPDQAIRRKSDPNDWEEEAIDALAKYVRGMVAGVEREVMEIQVAKVPRGWVVEEMGLAPDDGSLKAMDDQWRLSTDLLKTGALREGTPAHTKAKGTPSVTIYHADGDQMTQLLSSNAVIGNSSVKDKQSDASILNPEEIAIQEEERTEEERRREIEPFRIPFIKKYWEQKPRMLELLAVLMADVRNPETAKLVFKGNGNSKSIDQKRLLNRLGPGWTEKEVQDLISTLHAVRREPKQAARLAHGLKAFANSHGASERQLVEPSLSKSDALGAEKVGATPMNASSKLRVKP